MTGIFWKHPLQIASCLARKPRLACVRKSTQYPWDNNIVVITSKSIVAETPPLSTDTFFSMMTNKPEKRTKQVPLKPPLAVAHYKWWSNTHGAKFHASATPRVAREVPRDIRDAFFVAIRDNEVTEVKRILEIYPHLAFAKSFGNNERSALYTASFYARHEVVQLLLARGADRSLACCDMLPIAVVGYGRRSAVDSMKTHCMLADNGDVHVLLLHPPEDPTTIPSSVLSRRVQIHFSEPVDDFIEDDLVLQNCTVTRFAQITGDLYTATLQIGKSGQDAHVQVPAGVARSQRGASARTNLVSNVLRLP